MFNKFLLLLMILPTTMVWGRIHAQAHFQNQTTVKNTEQWDDEAPFTLLEPPTYSGTGCPPGSVEIVTPDSSTVSVMFSKFEAKTTDYVTRDRKACMVALPVYAAPGFSVGIFKVDYRGDAYVPPVYGSRAKFNAEYFWAGQRGPRKSRTYTDFDGGFFETDSVGVWAWSECGAKTNFRINTSIEASKRNSGDEDVSITMDSEDITQGCIYYFESRRC